MPLGAAQTHRAVEAVDVDVHAPRRAVSGDAHALSVVFERCYGPLAQCEGNAAPLRGRQGKPGTLTKAETWLRPWSRLAGRAIQDRIAPTGTAPISFEAGREHAPWFEADPP